MRLLERIEGADQELALMSAPTWPTPKPRSRLREAPTS